MEKIEFVGLPYEIGHGEDQDDRLACIKIEIQPEDIFKMKSNPLYKKFKITMQELPDEQK